MRVSRLITLMAFLLVATAATAHLTAAIKPSPITVVLEGLGCTTALGAETFDARSWSWGASNAATDGTGGGTSAGKAVVDELTLTRGSDACSPALLSGVMTGKSFRSLTLSQYDSAGVLKATVTLNAVSLRNWQIGGSNTAAEPSEQVAFSFERFTFIDIASGAKFCFDVAQQKGC